MAARSFEGSTENGQLEVNEEIKNVSPTTPVTAKLLPNLLNETFYLGGVPPGFKSGTTKAPGADNAFLGCIRDVQINDAAVDPMGSAQFFGVESKCREIITRAGFFGNGFIELPSHSIRKKGNFAFTFRTKQTHTILLVSTFPPNFSNLKELKGFYGVFLLNGNLHIIIDPGNGKMEIISVKKYNDGEYHVVNVLKIGRKIELRIDDEIESVKNLPTPPYIINMPEEEGGLYLGGIPSINDSNFLLPTDIHLNGAISDLVINNKMVTFYEARNFSNCQMGRSGPKMGSFNGHNGPISESFKQIGEGCQRVSHY